MISEEMNILTDDQINYSSLSDDDLRDFVLGEDLFVANSALATLAIRKSRLTTELAGNILENMLGDDFLQAAAINILFDSDPSRALRFLKKQTESCKPYVFHTILELMTQNSDFFHSTDAIPVAHSALKRIANSANVSKWPSRDVTDDFMEEFAHSSGNSLRDGDL